MPVSAADSYGEMVRAVVSQGRGLANAGPDGDQWSAGAARFREDPRRQPNETLRAILDYIRPDDVVLDVGGGAGRYLPIALHCRELVNVEPSASMGAQFEASATDAAIANARWLHSDWLSAAVEGDVCFSANVVHYIEDIVPFVQKLAAGARRRVMIVMHSTPPTNAGAPLFRLVHGQDLALSPGYHELLPVLWDLRILPDLHVLGPSDFIVERERFPDRTAAVDSALRSARLDPSALDRVRQDVNEHFDDLFVPTEAGFMRRPVGTARGSSRVLLITWETS